MGKNKQQQQQHNLSGKEKKRSIKCVFVSVAETTAPRVETIAERCLLILYLTVAKEIREGRAVAAPGSPPKHVASLRRGVCVKRTAAPHRRH